MGEVTADDMMNDVEYPTADEIHAMHERIVASDEGTEGGVRTPAALESALTYVSEGFFDEVPQSLDEKAAHLMRLIVSDHPYVDGNKRTALAAAAYLYDLNGYDLDVDDEVRTHLRSFATGCEQADVDAVVRYLREHATEKQ